MLQPARPFDPIAPRLPAGLARACRFGFLYWLCFLLALEPGNLLGAVQSGSLPSLADEVLRIGVAATLGALATALPALLTHKLPVMGAAWARRALVHAAGACLLSCAMILASCFLAAWLLQGRALPASADIRDQLLANWLLLSYAIGGLTAVLHAARPRFASPTAPAPAPAAEAPDAAAQPPAAQSDPRAATPLRSVVVRTRAGSETVDLAEVHWIETQGNYLALHTATGTRLLRETLTRFEVQLDPARFARIHRRMVVALDRIAAIRPAENGDACLRLTDGGELRVSRSYREALAQRWKSRPQPERLP